MRGETLRENTFHFKEQSAICLLFLQLCSVHHNAVKQHKEILSHVIAFVYVHALLTVNVSFNSQVCVGFFSIAISLWTAANHICNSILNQNKFILFEKLLCSPPFSLCLLPQEIFTDWFYEGLFGGGWAWLVFFI